MLGAEMPMDAQDTRTAQERIAQAESRLAALAEHGIDTAGLNSQLAFARASLSQGRTLDVLAMCEEVLIAAKRLQAQPPVATARPVKTEAVKAEATEAKAPDEPPATETVTSGLYPSPSATAAENALDRHRLTEEIRQAVQSDLMPKALSAAQLNERIRTTVERTLDQRLSGLGEQLAGSIDERFRKLAAEPSTTSYAKLPSTDELVAQVEERLDGTLDRVLTERNAGIEARLTELADPERLHAAVVRAVGSAVDEALAKTTSERADHSERYAATEATIAQLSATVAAIDAALPERIAAALGSSLPEAVSAAVGAAMTGVTEAVAGPVRELVAETLAKTTPPDLDAMMAKLNRDMQTDMDWQVERLAAERGWATLADVRAELRSGGTPVPATSSDNAPGFARLEAALVEFVRQTQSQQQQFLNVLQERVEQGTAVVAQSLAKAMTGDRNRSSAVFRQAAKPGDGETGLHNRATDARASGEQSALESHPSATDRELDVLSMTAQHRAIDTMGDPLRHPPGELVSATTMLPGTQVTIRSAAPTPSADVADATEAAAEASAARQASSATRPATMAIPRTEALIPGGQSAARSSAPMPAAEVDFSAETHDGGDNQVDLASEVIELSPVQDETGQASGLVPRSGSHAATGSRQASAPAVVESANTASFPQSTGAIPARETGADSRTPTRVLPAAASASFTAPISAPVSATAAHAAKTTSRVGAFEAGLRNLVKIEVERQLSGGLAERLRSALGLDQLPTANDLDQRVLTAVQATLAKQTPQPVVAGPDTRLVVPCDADLRAAIGRSMPDLLKDPAIRQQILGLVAVEAVANPGALGELTGIRAFIRAEVRHAAGVVTSPAHENDVATPATDSTVISDAPAMT